jgi:hypothetical protein
LFQEEVADQIADGVSLSSKGAIGIAEETKRDRCREAVSFSVVFETHKSPMSPPGGQEQNSN